MNTPITIGISACLFGHNTRYDGGNRHEPGLVKALAQTVTLIPLCPEAECGLGIPREPMRLEGDPARPRLMTSITRRELTGSLQAWTTQWLDALETKGIVGLVLKARSPSCGKQVAVHGEGEAAFSPGLFTRLAIKRFPGLPIADEEELRDPVRLANFLWRIAHHGPNNQENQG